MNAFTQVSTNTTALTNASVHFRCFSFSKTGGFSYFDNMEEAQVHIDTLDEHQVPYDVMTREQFLNQYPMYTLPGDVTVVLTEHPMGALKADACLKALQAEFVKLGGVLRDSTEVVHVEDLDEKFVRVKTCSECIFTCDKLIVCAGTWINKLLYSMGFKLDVKVI